jgi:putative protease
VGNVLGWENGVAKIRQRNRFVLGDTLEVLSPTQNVVSFPVTKIVNEYGQTQETAPHPNQTLYLDCPYELHEGDFLRRREEESK